MRALVSIFAGLLIVISLYQLSFTWFVNKHESAMSQKAERFIKNNYPSAETKYPGDKDAQVLYKDSLSLLVRARFKNCWIPPRTRKSPGGEQLIRNPKKVNLLLGLDLQGGINVTLGY